MRNYLRYTGYATLAALTLVTGCAHDKKVGEQQPPGDEPDMREPAAPDMAKPKDQGGQNTDANDPDQPTQPDAPKAQYTGIFHKTMTLDMSGKGVLPGVAGPLISAVAEINTNPGSALFDGIAAAGIPDVSDALNNLDPTLKSVIKAALDELLNKLVLDQVPAVKNVTTVLAGIADLTKTVEFHSQLAFRNYDATLAQAESQEQFYALAFTYNGNKQLFVFDSSILPGDKIAGGKYLSHIVPVNAPQADYKDALLDGGSLATFPIGDVFVNAIQTMVVKPLSGYNTLGDLLNSVIPCDQLQGSLGDTGVTICQTLVSAAVEAALSPIRQFSFKNVVVDRAQVIGYDVSTKQPTVDNLTSRLTGTQPITFTQVFSPDVTIKFNAAFDAERVESPMYPIVWP